MSGVFLRRAAILGLNATRDERMAVKRSGMMRSFRNAWEASALRYVDTASTFADSWYDLVLQGPDALRGDDAQVTIIILRRYLPATMASFQRLKVFDFPSSIAFRWSITAHFTNKTITRPITNFQEATSDDLLISFLIESEAMAQWFLRPETKVLLKISTIEVRLEDISTFEGAKSFLSSLPGPPCEVDDVSLTTLVTRKSKTDVVEEPRRRQSPEVRCNQLKRNEELVQRFLVEAQRQNISLPPLPHMEKRPHECKSITAAIPIADDILTSRKIVVTYPMPGSTVVLSRDNLDTGRLTMHFSIMAPTLGLPRAELHAERHIVIHKAERPRQVQAHLAQLICGFETSMNLGE